MKKIAKRVERNPNIPKFNLSTINFMIHTYEQGMNIIKSRNKKINKNKNFTSCILYKKIDSTNEIMHQRKNASVKLKKIKLYRSKFNQSAKLDISNNNKKNFVLLPRKTIYDRYVHFHFPRVSSESNGIRLKIIKKKNDGKNKLKIFSERYERRKKNASTILFDEFAEQRRKKFVILSYIQNFHNKGYVDKLIQTRKTLLY